jgi:hypothetical protein
LKHLRKFLSVAIGSTFEVDNPLIWKIKPEVVQLMMGRDASGLIADTISCTNVRGITRQHTHCGCCLQCLDRRFSILAANAAEHDPIEMYRTELLAGARPKTLEQTLAESYVRTALELREMGEHAFFDRFSGETTRVCGGFPSLTSDEIGRNVLDLHQRHGRAIGEVLEAGVGRHRAELVNRNLPPSSVLMMTIAPDGAPALPPMDVRIHTDAIKTLIDEARAETASENQRGGGYAADQAQASLRDPSPRSYGKSRPARERARDAIDELYPAGVPGQATEPNANLFRRVGEKLKQAGLPGVSDATILRAAGRRK